eukprot:GHVT01091600.1.p1 GENE.GHVT01091600.1~~GHVT01091600.1.p1  ORF type:complete len:128 (-),score=1.78 GHVT01091600.1:29-412(-)
MILKLRKQNKTQQQIAKLVGCAQGTICLFLKRSLQPNGMEVRPKSGRPRVTTIKEDRIFCREYMKDRRKSVTQLKNIVQLLTPHASRVPRPPVSVDTWRRRLKEVGLKNYTMKRKVVLTERNQKLRF